MKNLLFTCCIIFLLSYKQEPSNQILTKENKINSPAGADEMADVTNGGTEGLIKRRKAEINMFKNNTYNSKH